MKIVKVAKISHEDYSKESAKVLKNAVKPCIDRNLPCSGMTTTNPSR